MTDVNTINNKYIFGLDIGTRSIVGIVGYKTAGGFRVMAHYVLEHDTRAMIDGQIHDIDKVSHTIRKVKAELENRVGFPLKKVCIAAAGRVLKTNTVHVEQEIDPNVTIDDDRVFALEVLGIEKAHQEINAGLEKNELGYHCVGYTVTKYYLNDYEISVLPGHKGKNIGADVLATFLPKEVVESLYQVVSNADMEVSSLTLEPIAAIQVAIPNQYRLLNIALVDIGAGTSDIAITKDGTIIAYGMIPTAGDEITETIVHKYLVDFKTAEKLKIKSSAKSKTISYKDIMGISHKIEPKKIVDTIDQTMEKLANQISDKIKELNGGNPTNAVFIVGGGGRVKEFDQILAKHLDIPSDRVALRGKAVLDIVEFESKVKKSPELVTPIGICFSGMDQKKHDFMQVYLNDEPLKVFDTNNLTIMDIAAFKGLDPKKLIAYRGQDLKFTYNGQEKKVFGEPGEPAKIMLGNQPASLNDKVSMNDYITIIPARNGENANLTINKFLKQIESIQFMVNGEQYSIEPMILVNKKEESVHYSIKNGDELSAIYPTIKDIFTKLDISYLGEKIWVNNKEQQLDYIVKNNDLIVLEKQNQKEKEKEKITNQTSQQTKSITIKVNDQFVTLNHKTDYVFVDIFDYIDFDLSKPKGSIQCEINDRVASYNEHIVDGDILRVYWSKK